MKISDRGKELISRISKGAKEELSSKIEDTSIECIINYLEERSIISLNGRADTEARVNKEALKLAVAYLRDYLDTMKGDI